MTQISVVVPYYNEEDYLPATLESLKAQDIGAFVLILVNNASTDRSEAICEAFEPGPRIAKVLLTEDEPGKTWAIMRGIEEVKTPFVATCDADTYYPPEYLTRIVRKFQTDDNISAVLGAGTDSPLGRRKFRWVTRLMPRQCHSGGYVQAFRTSMLDAAGGFSVTRWPYVLEDHEIIHQIMKQGEIIGHEYSINMISYARLGGRVIRQFVADSADGERAAVALHVGGHQPWYLLAEIERIADVEHVEIVAAQAAHSRCDILQALFAFLGRDHDLFDRRRPYGAFLAEHRPCDGSAEQGAGADYRQCIRPRRRMTRGQPSFIHKIPLGFFIYTAIAAKSRCDEEREGSGGR